MRLWSLHPRHLDARGLVALWREGLLARTVLAGKTRGYRHHPQLERFRRRRRPLALIDAYLGAVCDEADARGYRFDRRKIRPSTPTLPPFPVAAGPVRHEWRHLLSKLRKRDPRCWRRERNGRPSCHPCFNVVPGGVAAWERTGQELQEREEQPGRERAQSGRRAARASSPGCSS
jgi:hypothetical protein